MPRYQFVCQECDYSFEIVARINEKRPTKCPECDGEIVQDYSTINVATMNRSLDAVRKHVNKQARKDIAEINRGNEEVLHDYCGDKPVNTTNSGVKYKKR